MTIKILLADSEQNILGSLSSFLSRSGYKVKIATQHQEISRLIETYNPEFIILDVLLSDGSGREILRNLRNKNNWTPVLILSQIGDSQERAIVLEEGADDYLNKPFDYTEILARIRAILRRTQLHTPITVARSLVCDDLIFDLVARRVHFKSCEVSLTPKATSVLEYLMTHPEQLITREQILNDVWGWDCLSTTRAVDIRITEIRRNLDKKFIETVQGQGYRFTGIVNKSW